MSKYPQATQLLQAIEQEMRRLELWQDEAPSVEALASTAPFCCDTLAFEQWLQFVFLPRMRAMVDARAPLPSAIAICPMAEETLGAGFEAKSGKNCLLLIELIGDFDELLSGQRVQERRLSVPIEQTEQTKQTRKH